MDTVEATKMVMSRIQKLDPENASKIMGYILIQDQGDNEMIRLAFGPENLLLSVMKQAKVFLDISSNTSSAGLNSSMFNGFHHLNLPSSPTSPWSLPGSFSDHRGSPRPAAASYAAVVNGGCPGSGSGSPGGSFYSGFNDPSDEFNSTNADGVSDQLPGFDDASNNNNNRLHRRSCSVNDVFLAGGCGGGDDVSGGFGGWRPCMYFSRGFCKNGGSCKFVHGNGGFGDEFGPGSSSPTGLSSPTGKIEAFEELLRIKAIQQQRIAAMAGTGVHPFSFNRSPSAALMMGDEFHKFVRCRSDRNEFGPMGFGGSNSSSRQIYLTFPADSTFKEEDVSNYFSMFGPVQDVRIPYQQKRMFGFVTFMLPETVKAILAKGNPHFVCDSRVLVKPYKEKGKLPDKKHQQQFERGDFSGCLSPTSLESAEPFDHIPFGARMFNHDMMLRRKLEERELNQAIEFQGRRLMNLQLTDLKNHLYLRSLSLGAAVSSPIEINQNLGFSSNGNNDEELVSGVDVAKTNSPSDESDPNVTPEAKEESSDQKETAKIESNLEHTLPDNLFASPAKSTVGDPINFSTDMPKTNYGVSIPIPVTSKCQGVGTGYTQGEKNKRKEEHYY